MLIRSGIDWCAGIGDVDRYVASPYLTQIVLQGESYDIRPCKSEGSRIAKTPLKRITHWRDYNDPIAIHMIDDAVRGSRTCDIETMVDALTLTNRIKDVIVAG